MKKEQLEAVHEALVEILDAWNDAAADEDRGRANDALVLTLWDDGSGFLGRRDHCHDDKVEDFHEFHDFDGLLKTLTEKEGVELDSEALWPLAASEAIATLRKQLPSGMEHCTIVYKRCGKGHGWLTATNWVEFGCPTCERDYLRVQLEQQGQILHDWMDEHPDLAAAYRSGLEMAASVIDGLSGAQGKMKTATGQESSFAGGFAQIAKAIRSLKQETP